MNRQEGMSSLLLVLLMFALGSLILQGMSVQHQALLSQSALESRALQETASAESLLEWGRISSWSAQTSQQCRQDGRFPGRVCLRMFPEGTVLLIASSGEQVRWQTGALVDNVIEFDSQGWSDFCPRKEAAQCLIL